MAAPFISGVSPASASAQGGALLTLTGTDLDALTAVYVGETYEFASLNVVNPTTATISAPAHAGGTFPVSASLSGQATAAVAWGFSSATSISIDVTPEADATHPDYLLFGADFHFEGGPGFSPGAVIRFRFASTGDPTDEHGAESHHKSVFLYGTGTDSAIRFLATNHPFPNPYGASGALFYGSNQNSQGNTGTIGLPYEWETGVTYRVTLAKGGTFTENAGGNWWHLSITNLTTSVTAADYISLGVAPGEGDLSPADSTLVASATLAGIGSNSAALNPHAAASFANIRANGSIAPTSITGSATGPYSTYTNITDGIRLDTNVDLAYPTLTYVAPAVTSVSPTSGTYAGGTVVTITGTNFTGATAVKFGTTAATSFIVNSSTTITAVAPAHAAGITDVTVTTSDGTSATSAGSKYTFVLPDAPTVTVVDPVTGSTVGGETITLTGTGFGDASAVRFGTTPATSFDVVDVATITAVVPAHVAGVFDVTVVNPGGTSAVTDDTKYTFVEPPPVPTVTGLIPKFGTTAGGTVVTITGLALGDVTDVSFGGTPAASFTIFGPTTIFATAPAGSAGEVDVTLTAPGGTSATGASSKYTYVVPVVPAITSLSPASGSAGGGTVVTIKGTNLNGVTAVSFDGTPATSFALVDSKTIRATAPSHSVGEIDITVTAPGGTSATSGATKFTYFAAPSAPTVTGLSVGTGSTFGGTVVTITGTNLTGATQVKFGSVPAVVYNVVNSTTITVTAPTHAAGTIAVTVQTPAGTSTSAPAAEFVYVAPDAPGGGLATITPPPPIPAKRNRQMRLALYDETMSGSPEIFTLARAGQSASEPANDLGTISFTLPYGDNTPAAAGIVGGKIVKVQVLSQAGTYVDCYLGRVEGINKKSIAQTRDARIRSFSCRSLASDFEKSKIYPHGGINRVPWGDVRTFGWAAPELDTSSWPAATRRAIQGDDSQRPPNGLAGFPYTWPNPLTFWLWGQAAVDGTHDPDGINYFQFRFTTSQELDVTFHVTADDLFIAALDGVPIVGFQDAPGDAADSTYWRKLKVPAGDHVFAVKAENLPRPGNAENTGIINVCATYDITPGDALYTGGLSTRRFLFTSVGVNLNNPQMAVETQVWKALAYPTTPPGMTPGQILQILLTEAQNRGELPGWTLGFNATVDSNGVPWGFTVPDFGMNVGDSFLQCLEKLMSDGWIDWAVAPGSMTLNAWAQGTRGTSAPLAVYAEGSNIEDLEHDDKWGGKRGKLLLRWDGGYTEVGSGQYGDFLSVSDATDRVEAARRGWINLDRLDDDSTGIVMTGTPLNDAQTPWIGFGVGSSITVPGPDGAPGEYIVTSIGAEEEDGPGRIKWTVQLLSRRRVAEDRLAKVAARAVPGGLNGRTDSVVAASPNQPAGGVLGMDELQYNLPGKATDADTAAIAQGFTNATSGPDRVTRRLKLQRATLEATGGTTGTSVVDFYVNGHVTISMFLHDGMLYLADHFGSGSPNFFLEVDPSQQLMVRLRGNPGDHSGMVLRIFGTPLP